MMLGGITFDHSWQSRHESIAQTIMSIQAIPYCPPTIYLRPDASLLDTLRLMLEKHVNHIPLCDENGGFAGIVSTNAILSELIPASARVEQGLSSLTFAGDASRLLTARLRDLEHRTAGGLANRNGPVLQEDCPILEAALMLSQGTSPLPVIGKDGKLRGMLSRRTLLDYLVQQAGI